MERDESRPEERRAVDGSHHSRCLLCLQPHVVCGEQLVHSPYMQCLASLAVGLHLDQLLCRPPVPPSLRHCPPESGTAVWCASEWAWLDCFSTTVKAAEALARGATFPDSFCVPDMEPVAKDEMALLMVSPLPPYYRLQPTVVDDNAVWFCFQDNSKWASGLDEQIMSWATSRPEVIQNDIWIGSLVAHFIFHSLEESVMPPVMVRSRQHPQKEKVLMLFVVCRTGIWGGNARCIFGVLADTGSWLRQAETSWYQPQQRPSLRHNRCRCPTTLILSSYRPVLTSCLSFFSSSSFRWCVVRTAHL